MKILGVVLELTPKRHWQSSLFTSKLGQIGQIGSTVIAGSFKMAPRIFIFQIAMGAEYLSYVKPFATFAITFLGILFRSKLV